MLNIVPSLDTPTCQTSTRKFNEKAGGLPNTAVLVISADLPFAMKRFCEAEGLNNVITLSTMRRRDFMPSTASISPTDRSRVDRARGGGARREQQGQGPQLVPEIKNEPDFDPALAALK